MILFIDCYDSFSYNLVRLLEKAAETEVRVVHNDAVEIAELQKYLPLVEAVVIGPGPGNPLVAEDAGVITDLLQYLDAHPVPLLGVCFGFQSLVHLYGGKIRRMNPPVHGQVSSIQLTEEGRNSLFLGVPNNFQAVRYHSLCSTDGSELTVTASTDGVEMGVKHPSKPFYGVQFHPESVLSTYGETILRNFANLARVYNQSYRVSAFDPRNAMPLALCDVYKPYKLENSSIDDSIVVTKISNIPVQTVDKVSEILRNGSKDPKSEFVCLESHSFPGQWTIFGNLEVGKTVHIRSKNGKVYIGPLGAEAELCSVDVFSALAEYMSPRLYSPEVCTKYENLPFVGGLVGYITYEGGCQYTTNLGEYTESGMHSDVSMVFVSETVLVNKNTQTMYVIGSPEWCSTFVSKFNSTNAAKSSVFVHAVETVNTDKELYSKQYTECQTKLVSGDSYELCLTTPTQVTLNTTNTWHIYKQLVRNNPAPYCSYIAFDDVLLATSPERFVAYDGRKCEFRPIKGTVRKGPGVTLESATAILKTPKEQAENLMIVDLIRHDLQHLLTNVNTPQLMQVEEYHSVYQLVTSIEGEFNNLSKVSGFDVLVQSLPPGSMTGAPKKRSVEILRAIEPSPRGIYSGVHGYWSIHNQGDWSVVIRSLFRNKLSDPAKYTLGAGGAITVLSTCDGEYEEMHAKLDSVLNALK